MSSNVGCMVTDLTLSEDSLCPMHDVEDDQRLGPTWEAGNPNSPSHLASLFVLMVALKSIVLQTLSVQQ